MPEAAKDAVVGFIGARWAIIAYTKAISGTGRLTESQLQTEMKNLPDPTVPGDIREKQFDRFQRNLDQAASGLPKIPGVEHPADIRARVEKELGGKADIELKQRREQEKANTGTGQFTDPDPKKSHKEGEEVIFKGRWRKITKIYPDGSFDMD